MGFNSAFKGLIWVLHCLYWIDENVEILKYIAYKFNIKYCNCVLPKFMYFLYLFGCPNVWCHLLENSTSVAILCPWQQ